MDNRPLSPHLQVYKPQLTSVLSILHRGTGVMLFIGLIPLTLWLMSIGASDPLLNCFKDCLRSQLGMVMLIGWSFCLFYHLCNGIRHLFWDMGKGFEMKNVHRSGWTVVFASFALTAGLWAVGFNQ